MTKRSRWARVNAPDLVDRITVATRQASGRLGATTTPAVTVLGAARGERTLTIGDDGEEVAAELTLKLAPTVSPVDDDGDPLPDDEGNPTELDALAVFALGSEVTALGHTGRVLSVKAASYRGRVERVDVLTS